MKDLVPSPAALRADDAPSGSPPRESGGAVTPSDVDSGTRAVPRKGDTIPGAVIVGVIALLVAMVSMPRFRAHVVRSNRAEVPNTLSLFGDAVFDGEWAGSIDPVRVPETLMGFVRDVPYLRHRFRDARPVAGSTELRHHGYFFDTGRVIDGGEVRAALVAWPVEFARTGDVAYALTQDGDVFVHRNNGLWTGIERSLVDVDLSDEGWLARSRSVPTDRALGN